MGVFVTDINKMVDFYTRVLGLVVSDRDLMKDGREIAFMTLDPSEISGCLCHRTARRPRLQYDPADIVSRTRFGDLA